MIEDQEVEPYYHEHELPRKRRTVYDDINTPYYEGGENDE